MNKVILMGRLTRDPEIRYSAGEKSTAIARYTLAVERRYKRMEKIMRILSAAEPLDGRQKWPNNISSRA